MLPYNWPVIFGCSLIPLVIGMLYYSDMALGKIWKKHANIDPNRASGGNMIVLFGMAILLGLFMSLCMTTVVLHGSHVFSLVAFNGPPAPNTPEYSDAQTYLQKYGDYFLTFKHGVFHGIMTALLCAFPIIHMSALFEQRGWRYTAVHVGYWLITLGLIGGVICAYGVR
jgi:Protein of unknown function (DUF1761)